MCVFVCVCCTMLRSVFVSTKLKFNQIFFKLLFTLFLRKRNKLVSFYDQNIKSFYSLFCLMLKLFMIHVFQVRQCFFST